LKIMASHLETNSTAANPTPGAGASEFNVSGMTCNNCARHVAEAFQSIAGVATVSVNLEQGKASVRWKPGSEPAAAAAVQAVKDAGYDATLMEPSQVPANPSWFGGWKFNVVLGFIALLPLVICEWALGWGMKPGYHWLAFALSLPVQVLCGARFYRGAWLQLKAGSSNMDTLVALGSTAAFGYSTWGVFAGWTAHLYFMESVAIITLISLGHWLESLASERAAGALKALMNLAPATARLLVAGAERDVPVATIKAGDQAVLKPGDRVPIDGEVVEGASAVDESMLTGESLPVDKAAGARLYGGTVNLNGRMVMRVTATGEATALAQIIAVVQRAQHSRASIQKLGDRVSSIFVPIVVVIALGTGLWWGLAYESAAQFSRSIAPWLWHAHLPETALAAAMVHAVAVLIVACPCAMGLATPAAIMAGTNAAARRGILIRDGEALEKSGTITAVVFDKTGTLTKGELAVAAVEDLRPASERAIKVEPIAASLAAPSNHPVSRAVAALGEQRSNGGLEEWQELRGKGVQARITGELCRLGSLNWLKAEGVETATAESSAANWSGQGATVLGLAQGRKLIAALALRDTLKPQAREVVAQLAAAKLNSFLLTGDNRRTAEAVAKLAGIPPENVFAEVRPEQKAEIVKQLQTRGERVAFVGDGINDAPALEQADLGIAVSRASDVAREAADIILLKSDIQAVPEALGLAQATLRTIKQNLFWAFFYNAAAVPLAALGFLSPILSAAAMGLSDLLVIGNALRLRGWKG
jgi:Cu+-exporting ATPase